MLFLFSYQIACCWSVYTNLLNNILLRCENEKCARLSLVILHISSKLPDVSKIWRLSCQLQLTRIRTLLLYDTKNFFWHTLFQPGLQAKMKTEFQVMLFAA